DGDPPERSEILPGIEAATLVRAEARTDEPGEGAGVGEAQGRAGAAPAVGATVADDERIAWLEGPEAHAPSSVEVLAWSLALAISPAMRISRPNAAGVTPWSARCRSSVTSAASASFSFPRFARLRRRIRPSSERWIARRVGRSFSS